MSSICIAEAYNDLLRDLKMTLTCSRSNLPTVIPLTLLMPKFSSLLLIIEIRKTLLTGELYH